MQRWLVTLTAFRYNHPYVAFAVAISDCAQNRWYVKLGACPPLMYASTRGQSGSALNLLRMC